MPTEVPATVDANGKPVNQPAGAAAPVPVPQEKTLSDEGFATLKAERDQAKAKLREYQDKEAQAAKAADEKRQKEALEKGNYQQIIEENNRKAAEQKAKDDGEKQALADRFAAKFIPTMIDAALGEIPNIAPAARKDIPDMLAQHLRYDTDDGTAKVVNPDGTLKLDSHGRPYDPKTFIKEYIQARPHLLLDNMPKRHGFLSSNEQPANSDNPREWTMRQHREAAIADPEGYKQVLYKDQSPQAATERARARLRYLGSPENPRR